MRSSDVGRAVVQHETSEEIISSEVIHSEVLQETLEEIKQIEVLGWAKAVSESQKFSVIFQLFPHINQNISNLFSS